MIKITIISLGLLITSVSPAFAQTTGVVGYITKDKNVNYEYNVKGLESSLEEYVIGGKGVMWQKYISQELIALKNINNVYINVNIIYKYIEDAVIYGGTFNVDDYINTPEAEKGKLDITEIKIVANNGEVEDKPEQDDFNVDDIY